jgi:hypothetical protein
MIKAEVNSTTKEIKQIAHNLKKSELFNNVPRTIEKVLKVLSYADNFDFKQGQTLRNLWLDYKDKGLEREDMFKEFKEKIIQLAIDIETYFRNDTSDTTITKSNSYIKQQLVDAFQARDQGFNYKKLLSLIEELNENQRCNHAYASFMLIRAIMDHIPPLLELKSFEQLDDNYSLSTGHKTDKAYIEMLIKAKTILHDALHRQISASEDLLDISDVPIPQALNRVLQICLESNTNATQPAKGKTTVINKGNEGKKVTSTPIVDVTLQKIHGDINSHTAEFTLTNKGQPPAILQFIDITDVPRQDLGSKKMLGPTEKIEIIVQLINTAFRTSNSKATMTLVYKDILGTTYRSTYLVNKTASGNNMYTIDSLNNFSFSQI